MKRSMSSDYSRFGKWDDDSNRPYKKLRNLSAEDDADSSNSNRCVPESDWWVVTSFLGKGSYGSVHLAVSTAEGEEDSLPKEMAIKTSEFSKKSRLENEDKYLSRLRKNPFIVDYFGNVTTQDKQSKKMLYNTIFEYCPGQCLAKHIKSQGGLVEDDVKRFSVDILIGLKWIHEKKIIHGDIKPKNILLTADVTGLRDNAFMAKISGFGRAMEKESSEYSEGWGHRRGTKRFMSPELVRDMVLDYGTDVWAFGCTVLEMLTGERVWREHGELDWEDWITLIGESGLLPYVPHSLSKKAKNFLSKCLERDPTRRWTVDRLIEHPFITRNKEIPEEEEDEEEEEEDIGVEAYEPYIEDKGDADIEEEEELEEIEDEDVDAYLAYGEPFEEEEAATEIDEEYPKDDSEADE